MTNWEFFRILRSRFDLRDFLARLYRMREKSSGADTHWQSLVVIGRKPHSEESLCYSNRPTDFFRTLFSYGGKSNLSCHSEFKVVGARHAVPLQP
jgi:hypothetical protein